MFKYPFTKQESYNECGSACISMIFKYYHGYLSLKTINHELNLTKFGTSAYSIIKFLKKYGFDAYGLKNKELENTKVPFIINHDNHFMLVYKVTDKYVILADPKEKVRKIKREDFQKIYNKIKIEAKPTKALPKEKKFSLKDTPIFYKKYIFTLLFILSIVSSISSICSSFLLEDLIKKQINTYISLSFLILLIVNFLKNKITMHYIDNIYKNIVDEIFKNIITLPYYYFRESLLEDILSKVSNLKIIKEMLTKIFEGLFTYTFNLIFASITLVIINKKLFLITIIFIVLYLIINKIYKEEVEDNINNYYASEDIMYTYMNEMISKYESINNLDLQEESYKKQIKLNNESYRSSLKLNKSLIFRSFHLTILNLIFTLLIYVLGTNMISHSFTLENLITYIIILNIFIEAFTNLIDININIKQLKTILRKAYALKENKPDKLKIDTIKFQNVNMYFDQKKVLDNINLKINKNEKVFVTGSSGSGKSTLFKLLKNYYKFEGNITTNQKINYVSLDDRPFSGTIKENINIKGINIDKTKLLNLEDINEEELLYDYLLFDSNLSNGQTETIVLARALEDCDTLIIDESLSLLESDKERKILKNILSLDKTIIFISHRLDNLDLFDRLIIMKSGKIIEDERRKKC